jgi:lipopolysaccharide transport system permease protein
MSPLQNVAAIDEADGSAPVDLVLPHLPVHRIAPSGTWTRLDLAELWDYRELLYFLVWREVKVRYKQTALGVSWAIIQPFFTMVVFSVFFGRLGKIPSDGVPYPLFAFCGLLPWQLFSFALTESSNSLVTNQRLITKVYFPRLIVPVAAITTGLVDFVVAFVVLLAMMAYYRVVPGAAIWTLPMWTLLAVATALAAGLWLSVLNVRYRDVRYTLSFLSSLWMFATPIAYPASIVPTGWRALYALNPMVGVIEGFRWALVGQASSPGLMTVVSVAAVAAMLLGGLLYFRRMEQTFADVI